MSLLPDFAWKTKYDSDGREPGRRRSSSRRSTARPATTGRQATSRRGVLDARVARGRGSGAERRPDAAGRRAARSGEAEVEAIERGQELRGARRTSALASDAARARGRPRAMQALELLSWMVARGPSRDAGRDPLRRPPPAHRDDGRSSTRRRASSKTRPGTAWRSTAVSTRRRRAGAATGRASTSFTDWSRRATGGVWMPRRSRFQRLWNDKAQRCLVIDVPTAVRDELLQFLPAEGSCRTAAGRPSRRCVAARSTPDRCARAATAPPRPTRRRRPAAARLEHDRTRRPRGRTAASASARRPRSSRRGRIRSAPSSGSTATWPPKLLIADEVGLGKTIEAGLLLRQAWLAGRAKRILILAPKAVLTQWQIELREKFNLNWPIYDGSASRGTRAARSADGARAQGVAERNGTASRSSSRRAS